ncbi:hypothetical protein Nham_2137 [Nitrobacter hamburgensis X14]|uniref:Uncharacterized protein n=1 Tax=Nitrobacter hamburgensis (strain DSM 10229 / NCIMB 13809 / X14) TaxID=323097 RepID=Q1QLG3_NITHX|nr:hypothetical protein Nham_2137 [Nitrobacter hamburgensis X14]
MRRFREYVSLPSFTAKTRGLKMQYLPDDDYNVAVAAAATLVRFAPAMLSLKIEHSPWTGRIEPDDVKLVLGSGPINFLVERCLD